MSMKFYRNGRISLTAYMRNQQEYRHILFNFEKLSARLSNVELEIECYEERREQLRENISELSQHDLLLGGDETIETWDKSVQELVQLKDALKDAYHRRDQLQLMHMEMTV